MEGCVILLYEGLNLSKKLHFLRSTLIENTNLTINLCKNIINADKKNALINAKVEY